MDLGPRVTLVDNTGGAAFTGVRLMNSTQLTLEGGTVSVFTEGAYAGEAPMIGFEVLAHCGSIAVPCRRGALHGLGRFGR